MQWLRPVPTMKSITGTRAEFDSRTDVRTFHRNSKSHQIPVSAAGKVPPYGLLYGLGNVSVQPLPLCLYQ